MCQRNVRIHSRRGFERQYRAVGPHDTNRLSTRHRSNSAHRRPPAPRRCCNRGVAGEKHRYVGHVAGFHKPLQRDAVPVALGTLDAHGQHVLADHRRVDDARQYRIHPDLRLERVGHRVAWFAFLLGFAHEEAFEITALCAGSQHCLELMSASAFTVIFGLVSFTMLLMAGYHNDEERAERYTPYLPAFSGAVLIVIGVGFITGLFCRPGSR